MVQQNKAQLGTLHQFFFTAAYALVLICFVLYSYTQIDLGLTLSQSGFVGAIQRQFQSIGFFNRPLSAALYSGILLPLFVLYGLMIRLAYQGRLSRKQFWGVVFLITGVSLAAFPAFSYDFFNYLFTAKTVLVYHKNPYEVIPLQFTGVDPWLSFMHWTHLPSAYTPLWIVSTLLPYLFGFGKLVLLIVNFKVYIALFYVLTIVGIERALQGKNAALVRAGTAIFALNPLVIVECLISPHNDIVMMAIAVWSLVLYQHSQKWASWFVLSVSISMKLMTLFLIPAFFFQWNKKLALLGMMLGFIAVLFQREVLSWYWIWVIPFVALVPEYPRIAVLSFGVSMSLLLRYVPFLYLGHWNDPAPLIKIWVTAMPIALSLVAVVFMQYKKQHIK